MTIDEAIEHAMEVARTCDDDGCAIEHEQLAEWLRTTRGADEARERYKARIRELESENERLRTAVALATHRRTRGHEPEYCPVCGRKVVR